MAFSFLQIMGLTNEKTGEEKFICAAFPSASTLTITPLIRLYYNTKFEIYKDCALFMHSQASKEVLFIACKVSAEVYFMPPKAKGDIAKD
jgi:GTP-dependent phosphoenolpyruvate carboxykinase